MATLQIKVGYTMRWWFKWLWLPAMLGLSRLGFCPDERHVERVVARGVIVRVL